MKSLIFGLVLLIPALAAAQEGTDHPVIGRIDGSTLQLHEALDYDAQRFYVANDPPTYETVEGRVTRILYDMPEGASTLQVRRSFEERLTDLGFEVLVSCAYAGCARASVGDMRSTVWRKILNLDYDLLSVRRADDSGTITAQIVAAPKWININVVETAGFENKAIDAEEVARTLETEGRMAFYDIHFDTGSATLTSDSDGTIAVIAEALAASPDLDVIVVGHTDNVGSLDANLALSRNRAQAVVGSLTGAHGVAADRLTGAGVAFLAPVDTNATDAGRAKNRRVEIVVR